MIQVHKVLLAAVIALGGMLVFWGTTRWRQTHEAGALALAAGGALAIVVVVIYWAKVVTRYGRR